MAQASETSFYKDLVYFLSASTLPTNTIRKLEGFDFSQTAPFAFVHTMYVSIVCRFKEIVALII